MFIAVVAAWFLIVGLFGNNDYLSLQARTQENMVTVVSKVDNQKQSPAQIKPLLAVPNTADDSTNLPRMSVAAGEAVQPVLKAEKHNAGTIRPVSIFDDTNGTGGMVKDDGNFDEWAK